jgi:hypothetical protein
MAYYSSAGSGPLDLLSFVDRWRRVIVLTEDAWSHILDEHAEMEGQEGAVDATVTAPERVTNDASVPERVCFYRSGVLPGRYRPWYVKVVVHFSMPDETGTVVGEIVTAYATPVLKRGETRIWP